MMYGLFVYHDWCMDCLCIATDVWTFCVSAYTQAGSEMMHRGVEDMVTGVGAIETVGLSDTQTIMIIQDETHGMHDTSQVGHPTQCMTIHR
ncbi:hypothetical protein DPMN_009102 [Dreissena polymorpha]|uniref:Uncharacterized protein n=1 Tax=Dreissena polymorpha TaxID=45954 RepID=A0A9D4MZE9_DREPO|nr:hypothetical protein DPMN_009102 [Dreissena polymorpha]